jgi:hypothetical protein
MFQLPRILFDQLPASGAACGTYTAKIGHMHVKGGEAVASNGLIIGGGAR